MCQYGYPRGQLTGNKLSKGQERRGGKMLVVFLVKKDNVTKVLTNGNSG